MEDITDADYAHAKRDFKIKSLGEYHDFHVQSDMSYMVVGSSPVAVS